MSHQLQHKSPERIDWGSYAVVLLGFLVLAISFSSRGALALVMLPWQVEFGWSRSMISSVMAGAMIIMAVLAPVVGYWVDRGRAKLLLTVGLLSIAACELIMAFMPEKAGIEYLWVAFGILGAIGFGLIAQHVVASMVAVRFTHNTGLATGIAASGSTGGQVMLLPILAALLQSGDWRTGFMVIGAVAVLLVPLVHLVLRQRPEKDLDAKESEPITPEIAIMPVSQRLLKLLISPVYHALFWSFFICGITTTGIIETHFVSYAGWCGFPPVPSTTAYSLLCTLNLCGMAFAGWLTDRVNRPRLLATIYFSRALCFVLLLYVGADYRLLLLFAVLFGIFDYSTVPVTVGLLARQVGVHSLGMSMGILSAGHAIGASLGALFGGKIFDASGSYASLWQVSAILAALAGLFVIFLRDKKNQPDTESTVV